MRIAFLLTFLLLVAFGTGARAESAPTKPINVVVTFSILGDFAQQVGGDRVHVTSLVGPDADVHAYTPAPQDLVRLKNADVVIVNGLGLDDWMTRLIVTSGFQGTKVVASRTITARAMEEDGETVEDPHAWQDVAYARAYVQTIADALAAYRPEEKNIFHDRQRAYDATLAQLDSWIRDQWARVPESSRTVITSHDAFGYFGAAYNVRFLAPQGFSTSVEPAAADVASLLKQMKQAHITHVFVERAANPRLIESLAKETGAAVGATVYADSLSDASGPAATYVDMMRHNVTQFVGAVRAP